MSAITVIKISDAEVAKLLQLEEGHFSDIKAIEISPAKLSKAISGFSNAEGGDLFIGIDENTTTKVRAWRGFPNPEAANGHIQCFETLFPLGSDYSYDFLQGDKQSG